MELPVFQFLPISPCSTVAHHQKESHQLDSHTFISSYMIPFQVSLLQTEEFQVSAIPHKGDASGP